MLSMQGRGQVQYVELGLTQDGRFTGLRCRVVGDCGAYAGFGGTFAYSTTYIMATGVYDIPALDYAGVAALTNTAPVGAFRGAGRPEAAAMIERVVDVAADELGIDPVDLRRRNFVAPEAFPFHTHTGLTYDSGDYDLPLREALRMLVHEGLLEGQAGRQMRVAGFSVQDMEQLYVQRIALETMAIRITIPRLTGAELDLMRTHHDRMREHANQDDYEAWEVRHRALHELFVAGAGTRTVALIRQLSDHAARYRRLYTTQASGAYAAGSAEHRTIVDACAANDADCAAQALAKHLGHTALGVIELVEPDYRASRLRLAITAASVPMNGDERNSNRRKE